MDSPSGIQVVVQVSGCRMSD